MLIFFQVRSLLCLYFQPDDVHMMVFCELMGVPCEETAHWLCHRKLKTSKESFVKPVPRVNAVQGRDALAKHIYARLFSWIVGCVNGALKSTGKQNSFIGVLDIYGYVFLFVCFYFSTNVPQISFITHFSYF